MQYVVLLCCTELHSCIEILVFKFRVVAACTRSDCQTIILCFVVVHVQYICGVHYTPDV